MPVADPLPTLEPEVLERICASASTKDARVLRSYVTAVESRPEVWFQRTLQAIEGGLVNIRNVADSAEAQGKINGSNIATLRGIVDKLPTALDNALEARLATLHAAAERVMEAEAVRLQLSNERERIEILGRKQALEREHSGALEGRELARVVISKAPWTVILSILASMIAGGSLTKALEKAVQDEIIAGAGS